VIKSLEGSGCGVYGHIVQEIQARAGEFAQLSSFMKEGPNGDAHRLVRGSISRDVGRPCVVFSSVIATL
jgi:hypothetical protein